MIFVNIVILKKVFREVVPKSVEEDVRVVEIWSEPYKKGIIYYMTFESNKYGKFSNRISNEDYFKFRNKNILYNFRFRPNDNDYWGMLMFFIFCGIVMFDIFMYDKFKQLIK
jgi:hypothetical protein